MLHYLSGMFKPSDSEPKQSTGDDPSDRLDKTYGAYCQLTDLVRWRASAKRFNISKRRYAIRRSAGPHRSPSRGRGMEFEDVRQYQAGDDIRHIDWRVSARVGKTHTKQFREEREIPILVVVDQRQSMFFGSKHAMKSVMACDIASLLAWSGLENGDRLGGIVFSNQQHQEIRPKKNRSNVLHFLNQCLQANQSLNTQPLAKPEMAANISMVDMLREIKRLAKPGFQIFIVSDFQDLNEQCLPLLRDISLHCECTALQIVDDLEMQLHGFNNQAHSAQQTIHTGQSEQRLQTDNPQWQAAYQSAYQSHQNQLEEIMLRFQIPVITANSSDQPARILQQHFARR